MGVRAGTRFGGDERGLRLIEISARTVNVSLVYRGADDTQSVLDESRFARRETGELRWVWGGASFAHSNKVSFTVLTLRS